MCASFMHSLIFYIKILLMLKYYWYNIYLTRRISGLINNYNYALFFVLVSLVEMSNSIILCMKKDWNFVFP